MARVGWKRTRDATDCAARRSRAPTDDGHGDRTQGPTRSNGCSTRAFGRPAEGSRRRPLPACRCPRSPRTRCLETLRVPARCLCAGAFLCMQRIPVGSAKGRRVGGDCLEAPTRWMQGASENRRYCGLWADRTASGFTRPSRRTRDRHTGVDR